MGHAQIAVVIPHSHTWFNTQTCVAKIRQHTRNHRGVAVKLVVVDNSWDWSPSIRGITDTRLGENVTVWNNEAHYFNRVHGSALDLAFSRLDTDLILTVETDAMPLRDGWLQFFLAHMEDDGFACGAWHHQQYLNPSFTLYRREPWERMKKEFCDSFPPPKTNAYWGPNFAHVGTIPQEEVDTIGPFCERRGWPTGTTMRSYPFMKDWGPHVYEPGQQFFHWAVEFGGYTFTTLPHHDTHLNGIPTGTYYGWTDGNDIPRAFACHYWGGTRALDPLKHNAFARFFNDHRYVNFNDTAVGPHHPYWLRREANFWFNYVPKDVQETTLKLIKRDGWVFGTPTAIEQQAIDSITSHYKSTGLDL